MENLNNLIVDLLHLGGRKPNLITDTGFLEISQKFGDFEKSSKELQNSNITYCYRWDKVIIIIKKKNLLKFNLKL